MLESLHHKCLVLQKILLTSLLTPDPSHKFSKYVVAYSQAQIQFDDFDKIGNLMLVLIHLGILYILLALTLPKHPMIESAEFVCVKHVLTFYMLLEVDLVESRQSRHLVHAK